jgi:hypothetical protein
MARRRVPRAALTLAAALAGAGNPLSGRELSAPEVHRYRPEHGRRALDLAVQPGDVLTLTAGGCLRAAGEPPAPVAAPYGEAAQALIFIPGVTMSFVPVADLLGRELFVPAALDYPAQPRVWLDWGRYRHGPVERPASFRESRAPCESPTDAPHVEITVRHGSTGRDPRAPGTLTLELPRYDRNLLPLDPPWAAGGRPNVCDRCEGFRLERGRRAPAAIPALHQPRCTLQRPYVDAGGCRPQSGECPGRGKRLAGHVDWGPATFTGLVSTGRAGSGPLHVALDSDVELLLRPDGGAGLLAPVAGFRYDGMIGLEFASAETTRWFRTSWWRSFPYRFFDYRPFHSFMTRLHWHPGSRRALPAFRDKPATVLGIFNIDTVHNHPEVHPVQGIAIQTELSRDRVVYQVFARNWGTGGDCGGRLDHALDLGRIALALKGAEGGWVGAEGEFFDHGVPFSSWQVFAGTAGPTLVIDLPRGRPCAVVEGRLTLRRGAASPASLEHWVPGDPPIGEPVRLDAVVREDQLCTREDWFRAVD